MSPTLKGTATPPSQPSTPNEAPQLFDSKFLEDEKVLCFHGPLVYEAKIQKVELREDVIKYLIHYVNWNKKWDEWVPESRILKFTEQNLEKKRQLELKNKADKQSKIAAAKKKAELASQGPGTSTSPVPGSSSQSADGKLIKSAKTDSSTSTVVKQASKSITSKLRACKRGSESDLNKDDQISSSESSGPSTSKKPKDDQPEIDLRPQEDTEDTEEQDQVKAEIKIKIPDQLKPYLVDDWDYLTRQRKLVSLPARVTVDQILNDYLQTKSKTVSKSNVKKSQSNKEAVINETTEGIKEYFNVMLGSQLLYKFEREQHADIIKAKPDIPICKIYGAIHLLRLFVKLGGMLTLIPLDDKSTTLLIQYIHDFLQYMAKNAAILFSIQDYGTTSPEYQRRAL